MAEKTVNLAQSDESLSEEAKRERRSLWMVRAFLLILVLSICINVILVLALKSLLPLERVQPFFLKVEDKKDQVIRVIRPNTSKLDMRKVSEALIRQYILNRLAISSDIPEMEKRWGRDGIISWSSSAPVYQEFSQKATERLNLASKMGWVRSVLIRSLTPYQREKGGREVWRANIELSDMTVESPEPRKSYWNILLRVEYQPFQKGIPAEHRLKNPMGFRVVNYSETKDTAANNLDASQQQNPNSETQNPNSETENSGSEMEL